MKFDSRVIIKLVIWSFLVGGLLYWLDWTPKDVWGWLFDSFATVWNWVSGTGIQYILVGAAIVVPVYIINQLMSRKKNKAPKDGGPSGGSG